jgi:hypothetical protein
MNVAQQLEALQRRIARRNDTETPVKYLQRLAVTQVGALFHLDFYGNSFDESDEDLFNTLAQPEIAPHIRSLTLRGSDTGANGTRVWDIDSLLATNASFSSLESFVIQLNKVSDHNRTVVGTDYEENGVLAKLLSKAPNLRELTAPSAPNADLFTVGERPLRYMSIDAGYDTQNFILNLSQSSCFPYLDCLEWGEYQETYMEDFRERCTPYSYYQDLFQSQAFAGVRRFVWRNPVCTEDEIKDLKKLRPKLQLLIVRASADYV